MRHLLRAQTTKGGKQEAGGPEDHVLFCFDETACRSRLLMCKVQTSGHGKGIVAVESVLIHNPHVIAPASPSTFQHHITREVVVLDRYYCEDLLPRSSVRFSPLVFFWNSLHDLLIPLSSTLMTSSYQSRQCALRCLVAGGAGFIGSHLSRRLKTMGHHVRIADIEQIHVHDGTMTELCDEFFQVDLRQLENCLKVCCDQDWVFNLCADMGGMGYIATHPTEIIINNTTIDLNLLHAAHTCQVQQFFYASSACVYPDYLQQTYQATGQSALQDQRRELLRHHPVNDGSSSLKESHAIIHCCRPQDSYGREKLYAEELAQSFATLPFASAELHPSVTKFMQIRIARFHNIYGPNGTWEGGREKVPAALTRKIVAAKLLLKQRRTDSEMDADIIIEVWGDGLQERSYCYVDDAVEGVVRMMTCSYAEPLNIGSSHLISINQLIESIDKIDSSMTIGNRIVYRPFETNHVVHDITGCFQLVLAPALQGVRSRSSDNSLVNEKLRWVPTTMLEAGLPKLHAFILKQLAQQMEHGTDLSQYLRSKV